jgi:hypothetical protein
MSAEEHGEEVVRGGKSLGPPGTAHVLIVLSLVTYASIYWFLFSCIPVRDE